MATVKGVNRTVADAVTSTHTLAPGLFGGNVKVMVDTYEAAALASGSLIEMGGELPVGARVLMVMLTTDALGGSVTCSVGDAESGTRYMNAEDCSSAGSHFTDLADGVEYEVDMTTASTPDNQILVTIGGASATGTIKLVVLYTHE